MFSEHQKKGKHLNDVLLYKDIDIFKRRTKMKNGNFVAKFDHLVNKAKTFKDRKKAFKKGYMKHKNKFKGDYVPFYIIFP